MIYKHREDFEKLISDAGIATTPEEMRRIWNKYNEDQGSLISNDSSWSPFWRLITSIVTTPAMWMVGFLSNKLLPNSFLKTAEGAYLDLYAWGVGLERKPGLKAQGVVTFTRQLLTKAITIPAGTAIQTPPINGTVYQVETLEDATFPDMSSTMDVDVMASKVGSSFNLAPGYYVNLPVPIEGGVAVTNGQNWLSIPGKDIEHDDNLRLRCQNQFTAIGLFHHDAAYRSIIMDYSGIRSDYIWFEHGAPRGPGTANAYLMIDSGVAPDDLVADINRHIADHGYHGHGDDMQCFPMPSVAVDIAALVIPQDYLTTEQQAKLRDNCEQMIRSAFRENQDYEVAKTWPYSLFSFSRLSQELHDTLPDLKSIEFNSNDLLSDLSIPVLGSLTVTIQADPTKITPDSATFEGKTTQ